MYDRDFQRPSDESAISRMNFSLNCMHIFLLPVFLIRYVDLFTLPTDYLTDEDSTFVTFHPSRLMGLFDILNTDSLVDLIIGLGAPKRKILVSLPANAYKFTLKDESENVPRSQTTEKEPIPIDREQVRYDIYPQFHFLIPSRVISQFSSRYKKVTS